MCPCCLGESGLTKSARALVHVAIKLHTRLYFGSVIDIYHDELPVNHVTHHVTSTSRVNKLYAMMMCR